MKKHKFSDVVAYLTGVTYSGYSSSSSGVGSKDQNYLTDVGLKRQNYKPPYSIT